MKNIENSWNARHLKKNIFFEFLLPPGESPLKTFFRTKRNNVLIIKTPLVVKKVFFEFLRPPGESPLN